MMDFPGLKKLVLSLSTIAILAGPRPAHALHGKLILSKDTQYVSGGTVSVTSSAIANTSSDSVYQTTRRDRSLVTMGVLNGEYDVTLKFMEPQFTSTGARRFHVNIEGQRILTDFDIYASAKARYLAVDKKYRVEVKDGFLNIEFLNGSNDRAIFSAVQVDPVHVLVKGESNSRWVGGSVATGSIIDVANTTNDALFCRYRWGKTSSSIPVAPGKYEVALQFAEMHFSDAGRRRFNVNINGSRKLTNYDIFAAARGKARAVERRYLIDGSSGKIDVNLDVDYARGSVDNPAIAGVVVKKVDFGAGFEGATIVKKDVVVNGKTTVQLDLRGWEALENLIGGVYFNNSGSPSYAYQSIVTKDGRTAMYSRVIAQDPAVTTATTRAQMTLGFKSTHRQQVYHSSHRMYLGTGLTELKYYPDLIHWFGIFEIWNQVLPGVSGTGSARWGIGINKDDGSGSPLYWRLEGQYMQAGGGKQPFDPLFPEVHNKTVPIPFGKWVTLDFYFKRGSGSNGAIKVTMTPDGGVTETLFNIKNHTIDPRNSGLYPAAWQPMKLYTSKEILDWMRARGKAIDAWYNDLRWYR
jgi:hypothetical protein